MLVTAKLVLLVGLLYLFVSSLGLLATAFRLLGGKTASEFFQGFGVFRFFSGFRVFFQGFFVFFSGFFQGFGIFSRVFSFFFPGFFQGFGFFSGFFRFFFQGFVFSGFSCSEFFQGGFGFTGPLLVKWRGSLKRHSCFGT